MDVYVCKVSTFYVKWYNINAKQTPYSGGSQPREILSPRGHLAMSGNIFDYHNCGRRYYWHVVGRGPGMLLNILQCPSPTKKNDLAQVSTVLRLRNPATTKTKQN